MRGVADWTTVWKQIDARRLELSWSKKRLYAETKLSEGTYQKMQKEGIAIGRPENRSKAAKALGWTPDSLDRILAGKKPILDTSAPKDVTLDDVLRKLGALEERTEALAQSVGDALKTLKENGEALDRLDRSLARIEPRSAARAQS